jgi:hypothetical protein
MTRPVVVEIKKPMTMQESMDYQLQVQRLIDDIKKENLLLTKKNKLIL